MGTYIETMAEVKTAGYWKASKAEVFPHPVHEGDKDRRSLIERPFYWQSYGMMGFFAGVRNYSETAVLIEPRGLPEDADDESVATLACHGNPGDYGFGLSNKSEQGPKTVAERVQEGSGDRYGYSWLSAVELLSFDYNQELIDRRQTPALITTYRDFLGPLYFAHLEALVKLGKPKDVRILFCFNG